MSIKWDNFSEMKNMLYYPRVEESMQIGALVKIGDVTGTYPNTSIAVKQDNLFGYKTLKIFQQAKYFQTCAIKALVGTSVQHGYYDNERCQFLLNSRPNKNTLNTSHLVDSGYVSSFNQSTKMKAITFSHFSHITTKYQIIAAADRNNRGSCSTTSNKLTKPLGDLYCTFCYKNNETADVYKSHNLYSANSKVLECPILRKLVCPICNATGDKAHTISYCPKRLTSLGYSKPKPIFEEIKKSCRVASGKKRR